MPDDTASTFTEQVGVPLAIAIIGLIATVAAAAVSFALARLNDSTSQRRAGYSTAVQELVAWAEYPYRIRRRTSDDADVLGRLAEIGHAHQEALLYRQTWIAAEDPWTSRVFAEVRTELATALGPACNEAWNSAPITRATEMSLAGWGPAGMSAQIERFVRATQFRFGWRRLISISGWHPGA